MLHLFIAVTLLFSNTLIASSPLIIGIAGGTGSGKTTLSQNIHSELADSSLIEQDCYYKDLSHLSIQQRAIHNFDHPQSIDFDRLFEDLCALKKGEIINKPIYNFKTHAREEGLISVMPSEVIIVEGILIFNDERLRALFDLKIYVDTEDDIRILRRIERDILERGRDFASVKNQYFATVKPMHDQFVVSSKHYADMIIPGDSDTTAVVNLILDGLRKR